MLNELEHSGVKGMRWRKGRKTPFDASNTNLKRKTPDSTPRVEKQQTVTLTGKAKKKITTEEKTMDNQAERNDLASKMADAAAKDRQDRAAAANKALKRTIAKAKKVDNTPKEEPKTETKKTENRYVQFRHVSRYRY